MWILFLQSISIFLYSTLLCFMPHFCMHYSDIIMSAMASQITGFPIVCSTDCSDANQRNHQSSESLTFVGESTGDRWILPQRASNSENVLRSTSMITDDACVSQFTQLVFMSNTCTCLPERERYSKFPMRSHKLPDTLGRYISIDLGITVPLYRL